MMLKITITVKEVEYIAFRMAKENLSFNEPILAFSTRFPNVLESCLATPFQSFSGKYFYPTFIAKASILFYLMIKNRPFQNGNKRIAMTTLLFFFHKNKKWIRVNIQEFYNFTMWVTRSPRIAKEETIKVIEKFFKKYIINLK